MDLFKFPFSADVWGTFSDVAILIATIITARYLYLTLQSQKDVQRLQVNLMQLEQRKFSDTLKPVFKYEIVSRSVKVVDVDSITTAVLLRVVNISKHRALKVRAGFSKVENLSDFDGCEFRHLNPGTALPISFTVTSNHKDLLDENNVVKIQVTYSDTFKATYLQRVEYIDAFYDHEAALTSQDPILLDETVVI